MAKLRPAESFFQQRGNRTDYQALLAIEPYVGRKSPGTLRFPLACHEAGTWLASAVLSPSDMLHVNGNGQ
ncbi:uncharacterized protein UV8b_00972 [Ustilaginoidea virens]|uniref:Uncharacterized protein n=1 Tax=Ustilaginoidea virens TaxID=1159556 RepID=A0A8E5MEU1_USTVR|nr:uncharacterized protein UV8b_00972 [Ustilaginoidea virens]QUC16731.1 hypothetical protein UV8b_00972 [Ustilaginoidea virens]